MSVSDKEISNVGGSGDDDDHNNSSAGGGLHINTKDVVDDDNGKKQRGSGYGFGIGCTRSFTKAKQVVLYPFTKFKRQLLRRKNKRASSSADTNSRISGKRFCCVNGGKGCYFCFKQPQTFESNSGSRTTDPNDPNFTYDMLKVFIENNDFYSKECNPHLDFDLSSHALASTYFPIFIHYLFRNATIIKIGFWDRCCQPTHMIYSLGNACQCFILKPSTTMNKPQ